MKKWTKLFSLAIGALMAIGAAVGVKQTAERVSAESDVLIIDGSKLTGDATTGASSYNYGTTEQQMKIKISDGAKQQSSSGENKFTDKAILIGKSGKYIYNETAFPGKITKFEIYANKGASSKVSVGVKFSDTAIAAYATGTNTYTQTLATLDSVYDCSSKLTSNCKYFWYQVTNANNSQVQFRITYEKSITPSTDVLQSLAISGSPNKTTYQVGESFNPEGLIVTGTYSESRDKNVTSEVEWNVNPEKFTVASSSASATVVANLGSIESDEFVVNNLTIVNNYPEPAIDIDDVYVITASADLKNYELTGIGNNIGSYAEYTTTPAKTYPLTVCEGCYENTIAFKNGDNYLALTVDDNKLSTLTSVTEQSSWIVTFSSNVYSIKNVAFSRYLKYNKTSPRFACYVSGQTDIDLYQISTDPSISISCSSDVSKLMAGNSYEFIYETENISGTPSITWTSSNTDVATIASDGTLTGVGLGITNITATANGSVTSDPIQVTVWPNNSKTIAISNAISIAQFAGENKSPFTYTVEGNVTVDNAATFTLTDSTGSLRVYLVGNKVSVNDHVVATGLLQMYTENKDSVPSMRSKVSLDCSYNVYFISEGNQFHVTQNVADGDMIENPGTPTPSNESFSFVGWFDGNRKWDFDTDTVNQDVTLVANWSNGLDTSAQLNIRYNYNEATTGQQFTDVLTSADFEATDTSYVAFSDVETETSTAVYAGNSAKDNSGAIQLRSSKSESGVVSTESAGFVKSVSFEVSSGGNRVDVYGSNNPYNDAADLYGSSQGTLIGTSTTNATISFEGQYKYFGLRSNSGAIYLSSITIVWDSSTPFEVTKVDEYALRFSCEFDDDTIASYFETPANWKCGFMVAQTAQMEKTFEESYEYLQDVLKISEDPIADVAAGAMKEDTSAKVSMYKNTMDQLPTPVDDKYEFSVNVTIPETKLTSVVSATWFAYNTVTKEMVFASQKNMSIKEICGIYTTDEDYLSILTANQKEALDCIVADHGWTY